MSVDATRLHIPAGTGGDGSDPLVVTPERCGWSFAGLRVVRLAAGERLLAAIEAAQEGLAADRGLMEAAAAVGAAADLDPALQQLAGRLDRITTLGRRHWRGPSIRLRGWSRGGGGEPWRLGRQPQRGQNVRCGIVRRLAGAKSRRSDRR